MYDLNVRHKDNMVKVQFIMVSGKLVPILELRTCNALNMINRIDFLD